MFNTVGLDDANTARRDERIRRVEQSRERNQLKREAEQKRKQWQKELLVLWRAFVVSDDYIQLLAAMRLIKCSHLTIHQHSYGESFEFHPTDEEKPFVVIYVSGGYCAQRSVTPHSSEGYFELASKHWSFSGKSPQEALEKIREGLNDAFKQEKHSFRYKWDTNYRQTYDDVLKKKARKEALIAWTKFLSVVGLVALVWWYFS
jgi:hypothetical protein